MKPIVKRWYIQDVGFLEDTNKINPCFHLGLDLEIGYESSKGIDDYSIDICDKEGLKKEIDKYLDSEYTREDCKKSCYFYKTLLLKEYDREEIIRQINEFVNSCSGETWEEVNLKLQAKLEYNP
jgi:hypothetical protein